MFPYPLPYSFLPELSHELLHLTLGLALCPIPVYRLHTTSTISARSSRDRKYTPRRHPVSCIPIYARRVPRTGYETTPPTSHSQDIDQWPYNPENAV